GDGARLRPLAAWLAVTRFGASATLGLAGGHTSGPAALSEAASMRRFLETPAFRAQYGRLATARPQPREVVLEEESTSTDSNVARIIDLVRQHRWGRILLVTNQYHVPRVRLLAELRRLAADVVSAEAIVDAAIADPKIHELLCAREGSEGTANAIRQERTYMTVLGLLRS
ncbi:MAG TPA: ElyC/SanA/YdcF family protein, partial [Chloroflexota bacterium]